MFVIPAQTGDAQLIPRVNEVGGGYIGMRSIWCKRSFFEKFFENEKIKFQITIFKK